MQNDWWIDLRITSYGRKEPGEGQATLVRAEYWDRITLHLHEKKKNKKKWKENVCLATHSLVIVQTHKLTHTHHSRVENVIAHARDVKQEQERVYYWRHSLMISEFSAKVFLSSR